ncbi:hypothetical protein C8R45DRAFT_1006240, partial [Mycena sanguinolenta]
MSENSPQRQRTMLNKIIATSIFVFILAAAVSAQTIQCECPPFESDCMVLTCSSPKTCCNTEPPTCVANLPHGPVLCV